MKLIFLFQEKKRTDKNEMSLSHGFDQLNQCLPLLIWDVFLLVNLGEFSQNLEMRHSVNIIVHINKLSETFVNYLLFSVYFCQISNKKY